jgi:predicted glycoside hydrolase/deacetylase ChbG (UPF0249 family)
MAKYLIVNADDFGYTRGINRGIIEAHVHGIVSSTSLMVDMPWITEAANLARHHPRLGVGLHFVATNESGPIFNLNDVDIVKAELNRQYKDFCAFMGRPPTHLDSHQHVHLRVEGLKAVFLPWADEHRLPLRNSGGVHFNGEFYGHSFDEQWRAHPAPELISIENLEQILRALPEGITELACHPGYATPDLDSYAFEREIELSTLVNPRLPDLIRELRIELINFAALQNIP